jgi:hypothetical protein
MKGIETQFCPPTINGVKALGADVKKALWISFADNGTPYDFDKKVFMDAREALAAYRKFKKITKYKLQISKVWAFYQLGRLTWLPMSEIKTQFRYFEQTRGINVNYSKFVKAPLEERKKDCLERIAHYTAALDPANYQKIPGFESIVESKLGRAYNIDDYRELLSEETKYLRELFKE